MNAHVRMNGRHISDHEFEMTIKSEVVKIKDTMPSCVRNVQVRANFEPTYYGGMFEHISETVIIGMNDVKMSKTDPIKRLKFVLWHEYRHALQYRVNHLKMNRWAVSWMNKKPITINEIIHKLHLDQDAYNLLPWEQDANAYALQNVPDYCDPHPISSYERAKTPLKVLF